MNIFEHLYSPKQAARQTEDRLYTHGREVHTAIQSQKCIKTNIKHSPERLTRHCELHHIYDKTRTHYITNYYPLLPRKVSNTIEVLCLQVCTNVQKTIAAMFFLYSRLYSLIWPIR